MIKLDPEKVQYEITEEYVIPEVHSMPLEIMKLLGIAKEENTKDDREE